MWVVWLITILLTARYTFAFSPQRALWGIYLPVLILLPQAFSAKIPGLPEMSIVQAVIIPIFFVYLLQVIGVRQVTTWKWGLMDFLVIAYIAANVYAEYLSGVSRMAEGGNPWINLLANMMSDCFAPYVLGKSLIMSKGYHLKFSKRFVFLVFVVVLISAFEEKFVVNPFLRTLQQFFPADQSEAMNPSFRYGFVRIKGSFLEPIYFGIGISTALLLNYWLIKNRLWSKNFSLLPSLYITKGVFIFIVLLGGLVFTFSRGPLAGAILGFLFIGVGFSRTKWMSLGYRIGLSFCLMLVLYEWISSTASVNASIATTEEGNVAYRELLLDKYITLGMEYPTWGWNFRSIPDNLPLPSIDNHYLWVFLRHGLVPLSIFMLIIFYPCLRLLIKGMMLPLNAVANCSMSFTFLSILIMIAFSIATVFMGGQLQPIFFLLIGWIEGYLRVPDDYDFSKQPSMS